MRDMQSAHAPPSVDNLDYVSFVRTSDRCLGAIGIFISTISTGATALYAGCAKKDFLLMSCNFLNH